MAGVLVILLGVAVAVVAVIALQKPSGNHATSAATTTTTTTRSATTAPASGTPTSGPAASPAGSSGSRSSSSAPAGSSTPSAGSVRAVPLVVLNNTATSGLASQAAKRFESGGWTVTRFGNYSNAIISTCAYYDPAAAGAKAAAQALMAQYPTIKRIKEKFAELPAGPVVVVLTPGYTSG